MLGELLDGYLVGSVVREVELEGVCASCNIEVRTVLSQSVYIATPVDTPVVVSTELELT